MLSNSAKYAIKAVLYLAMKSDENNRIMVKDISEPINVPQAYIAKLLQQLSREGIISSVKGPKGGFYLNDDNKKNTLMDVINVVGDEDKLSSCVLSLKECNAEKPCPLHELVNPSKSIFLNSLKKITLQDYSNQIKNNTVFLPL